jgi:hypothetical protein
MLTRVHTATLRLADKQVVRARAENTQVCNEQGTLWVTSEDDPEDVILSPGECLALGDRRGVIVQALGSAVASFA